MEIPSASTAQVANPSNSRQSLANTSNEVKELTQVAPATAPSESVQTDAGASIPAVDNTQASRSANNEQEPGSQETFLNAVESQIQQANIERQISQAQQDNQSAATSNNDQEDVSAQSANLETPNESNVEQGNDIQDEIEAIS